MDLYLKRFRDPGPAFGRYRLDPRTGARSLELFPTFAAAARGCAGFADELRLGVRGRREAFVALFARDGDVVVRVDGREFAGPGLAARRSWAAPFVKRFEVQAGGDAFQTLYWFWDNRDEWPGPEATDLFLAAAEALRTPAARARFAYLWTESARGRDTWTPEFVAELERHLATAGAGVKTD